MKEKRKERQEKGHAGRGGGERGREGERDEVRERGRKRGRVVALSGLAPLCHFSTRINQWEGKEEGQERREE